jgi:pimeloyl-ACP methyl ester carboxylesterase
MAKELRILLEQLNLGHRPLILVAHSFGGIIAQTFVQQYENANVIGLVLLDPPLDYSPLVDKMPRMLRLTGNVADSGLLRIASIFGVLPIQLSSLMRERLGGSNFRYLSELLMDSNSLCAMADEMEQFKYSLEHLKNAPIPKRPKMGVVTISPTRIDKPKEVQMGEKEYTEDWHGRQKEQALSLNGLSKLKTNFILAEEQHADLCVSDSVTDAIDALLQAHGLKVISE